MFGKVGWSCRIGQKVQDLLIALIASATSSMWSHPGLWAYSTAAVPEPLTFTTTGLWPCCWPSVAFPSWIFHRDCSPCGAEHSVRFLQESEFPSLYSFYSGYPKNLKERQHPMLFSWDGSGTETTCYFRTSELAPSLGQKKKKKSQFTLRFSLPSSPCSFNFHSRK